MLSLCLFISQTIFLFAKPGETGSWNDIGEFWDTKVCRSRIIFHQKSWVQPGIFVYTSRLLFPTGTKSQLPSREIFSHSSVHICLLYVRLPSMPSLVHFFLKRQIHSGFSRQNMHGSKFKRFGLKWHWVFSFTPVPHLPYCFLEGGSYLIAKCAFSDNLCTCSSDYMNNPFPVALLVCF